MYINTPHNIPTNMYPLSSPLLNLNIEYNIIEPVIIQKHISSKYVIKSAVLKDFLSILKTSNSNPIKKPFSMNIANR